MIRQILAITLLFSTILSAADAAVRRSNCVFHLNYQHADRMGRSPYCDWKPVEGPMEVSIYVDNMPDNVRSVPIKVDCMVDGVLKGPWNGLFSPIQGKKNFYGNPFASDFPITWTYSLQGDDHGNILVYVDESLPEARILCKGELAPSQSLDEVNNGGWQ